MSLTLTLQMPLMLPLQLRMSLLLLPVSLRLSLSLCLRLRSRRPRNRMQLLELLHRRNLESRSSTRHLSLLSLPRSPLLLLTRTWRRRRPWTPLRAN